MVPSNRPTRRSSPRNMARGPGFVTRNRYGGLKERVRLRRWGCDNRQERKFVGKYRKKVRESEPTEVLLIEKQVRVSEKYL